MYEYFFLYDVAVLLPLFQKKKEQDDLFGIQSCLFVAVTASFRSTGHQKLGGFRVPTKFIFTRKSALVMGGLYLFTCLLSQLCIHQENKPSAKFILFLKPVQNSSKILTFEREREKKTKTSIRRIVSMYTSCPSNVPEKYL